MACAELAKMTGALVDPTLYGPLITGLVALGFGGSVPIWFKAGREYTKRVEGINKAKPAMA